MMSVIIKVFSLFLHCLMPTVRSFLFSRSPQLLACSLLLLLSSVSCSQTKVSVASDVSLMRNFSKGQTFVVMGQTIQGNFHFTKKESAYAWISYHTQGQFTNAFTAPAKSPATNPSAITYEITGKWRSRQVSVGWKHFFKGSFNDEEHWHFYGLAGFGLYFPRAENVYNQATDTLLYDFSKFPRSGVGEFKRLTIDLGLGAEFPLSGNFFLYADTRVWLPASNYASPYLHYNKQVPLPVLINAGLRVLFDISE